MTEVLLARLDDITAAAAGAIATVSNTGTVGVGIFKQKTGTDAEFYKINPTSSRISFSIVGTDRIDIDAVEANFTLGNLSGQLGFARIGPMATDTLLGRDTAGSGAAEEIGVGGGIEFTGAGAIQRSALTGDITAPAGSNATTLGNDVVINANLRNSGPLSVIGRSANTSGDPADISATAASGAVLRESGSVLGFGTVATAGIANDAITYAKMQNISTTQRVIGRTSAGAGDPEEASITQLLDWIGSTRGSILYRGSGGWAALTPGTATHILTSNGAGADPSYQAPATTGWTKGTPVNLNGATNGAFTGLPSTATIIFLSYASCSLSGTNNYLVQIGDSGGLETTGYVSASSNDAGSDVTSTAGFIMKNGTAANLSKGGMVLIHIGSNQWQAWGVGDHDGDEGFHYSGTKTLSGTLDRISLLTDGADTFDNASAIVNIAYL